MGHLVGRRILVTRDEGPGGPLCALLRREGAVPVLRPTVQVRALLAPEDRGPALLPLLRGARWLVLTSPRAVDLLDEGGIFRHAPPPGLRVAVAGSGTAAAVEAAGWPVALVPEDAGGAPVLDAMLAEDRDRDPGRVVFPASSRARSTLPDGLRTAGYRVDQVSLYEPAVPEADPGGWDAAAGPGQLDALTFTSPSAVEGLVAMVGQGPTLEGLRRLPAATQGPTTGDAARSLGWGVVAEAEPRTFQGLVKILETLLNHDTGVME